ncbi:hypothetical protein DFH29DRAFT_1072963 [Suillus ampliporus]|nr:hypothetical protein DFH29DRAFT_1072963 [Suillus ampliporus]
MSLRQTFLIASSTPSTIAIQVAGAVLFEVEDQPDGTTTSFHTLRIFRNDVWRNAGDVRSWRLELWRATLSSTNKVNANAPGAATHAKAPFAKAQVDEQETSVATTDSLRCESQMDPITSGLTILQVVETIARASALLYRYIASVRNADSSCRGLLNELRSIGGVLTTVMKIETDDSLPDEIRGALSQLMVIDGPVTKLQVELQNLLPTKPQRSKMGKFMWPFKEQKMAPIVDKFKQYCREITGILEIDTWITLKGVDRGVHSATQKVREIAEERRKLLHWMAPVSCKIQHDQSVKWRSAETGQWIFETDQYKTWNTSDCAFLWLDGQPGAGKTILASAVIEKIREDGEAEPQTLAYFYCNFRDEKTTIASAVLRTLACNLLQESQDDWTTKIGEQKQQQSDAEGNLVSLRKLGQQYKNGEQCPTDLVFLRKILVEAIEPNIKNAFYHLPTMSLKDKAEQMREDIHVHIAKQLKTQNRLSGLDEELKMTILEKLLEKADGMFRWVQCQLDEILTCKRSASIRKLLDSLPKGLYETYDRIIRSIEERGGDDGPIAQRCLLLLAGTFTPLTLDELNEAMMIEVGESKLNRDLRANDPMDIVVACRSFVTYDEATGVVALSHYSVKEYLIGHCPNYVLKSISDMHARIFLLLATYLVCPSEEDSPLLRYAINGLAHLEDVSDEDPCFMAALSRLQSQRLEFGCSDSYFEDARRYKHPTMWLTAICPSVLLMPLELGNRWMVEFLVKEQPCLLHEEVGYELGSPLIFAIYCNPDFLGVLLKLGVDLNKPSQISPKLLCEIDIPEDSYTPILWAAAIGSKVAVDFLLSQPEVKLPDNILHMAIIPNDVSPEVIRMFRHRGADANFTVEGSTPIHTVLSSLLRSDDHWLQVVKALVQPSCNLSVQDWSARTALHIALDRRLQNIITYLRQNAQLSGTATLRPAPDMWSWAKNEKWFPKIQAAALAADQPRTRIKGKIIDANTTSQLVEFPGALTANHEDPNPICAVVVSAIVNDADLCLPGLHLGANLSRRNLGLRLPDFSSKEDTTGLKFNFSWSRWQRASSCLIDYHQGDLVTSMLRQLTSEDVDSSGTSLFLQIFKGFSHEHLHCALDIGSDPVECMLDIYRGPLH